VRKIGTFAKDRMARFGLTEDHVNFVLDNSKNEYQANGATVYQATLPDGRGAKVRVSDGAVIDAFTHGNIERKR
jgi:hypothetical protein